MHTNKEKEILQYGVVHRLIILAVFGSLLGLADGLNNFFLYRMTGAEPTGWVFELLFALSIGAVLGVGTVFVAAGILLGLGRVLRLLHQGKIGKITRRISEGLESPWAAGGAYLLAGFFFSSRSVKDFLWALLVALCLLAGVSIWRNYKLAKKLIRFAAVPATLLATWAIWYVTCVFTDRQFPDSQTYGVWLKAGLPVVLVAAALNLGLGKKKVSRAVFLGVALLLAAGWLALQKPEKRSEIGKKPSVLFLVIDTLRSDRVESDDSLMPAVEKLASQGVYYKWAYTAFPKTQQSVASFMTGLYPWNNDVQSFSDVLSSKYETIAERFYAAGYRTASFVHNPWIDYGRGHEQGFGEYGGYLKIESLLPRLHDTTPVRILDGIIKSRSFGVGHGYVIDGKVITDAAVDWLDEAGEKPFFLWVHYFDPHWPYTPAKGAPGLEKRDVELAAVINQQVKDGPSERQMRFKMKETGIRQEQIDAAVRLYDVESAYNDLQVKRLMEKVESLDSPPIVVFLADHGESLGEHNYYFHHGDFTYNACLHVPLVVSWPGHVAEGKEIQRPVKLVDVAPTLVSLAGIDPGKMDGKILPGLNGKEVDAEDEPVPFMSEGKPNIIKRIINKGGGEFWRGIIVDGKKFIEIPKGKNVRYELYDLIEDPDETHNLYEEGATDISVFLKAMEEFGIPSAGEVAAKKAKKPKQKLSDAEKERLRALGYMQ